MRSRPSRTSLAGLLAPAAAAAVLCTAGPASALTGYGVSGALRGQATFVFAKTTSRDQARTCEKSREKRGLPAAHGAASKSPDHRFAPVACEQPPRSEVDFSNAFKQASASALAALG